MTERAQKKKIHTVALRQKQYMEELDNLYDRVNLQNWFDFLANHCLLETARLRDNSLYVYCDPSLIEFKPTDVVNIKMKDINPPGVFFQWSDSYYIRHSGGPEITLEGCIEINLNDIFFGYYFKPRNMLFLTDISHDMDCIETFVTVWEALKKTLTLKQLRDVQKNHIAITLGCDPEWEVVDKCGYVVDAQQYLKRVHRSTNSEVGIDGAGAQMEIRPPPASTPDDIVKNIKSILTTVKGEYSAMELSAKGDDYPIGMHIHFGGWNKKITPPKELLTPLDDFLYYPTIKFNGGARGTYMHPSMYEPKDWGFEYRSLPSALGYHPEITKLVFKIAQNLIANFCTMSDFEYNVPPHKEDYITYAGLTEDEADKWFEFLDMDAKDPKMYRVLANWVDTAPMKLRKFGALTFKDEWNKEIMEAITREVGMYMRRSHTNLDVVLYGFRGSRGRVTSLALPWPCGYKQVDLGAEPGFPPSLSEGTINIGIGKPARTNVAEFKKIQEALIEAMKGMIRYQRDNFFNRRGRREPMAHAEAGDPSSVRERLQVNTGNVVVVSAENVESSDRGL